MTRRVGALAIACILIASGGSVMLGASTTRQPVSSASARATLDRYCVSCHNQRLETAGLTLDTMDLADVSDAAEIWEKVVSKLRAGTMPPPGRPRPDQPTYDGLRTWLEVELDAAAAKQLDPGRTETFHRLSRTEYRNGIRDLLALDVDVTSLLPADDVSYGFDNIAGILKLNQTNLERYLAAARKVSGLAVRSSTPPLSGITFSILPEFPQYERVDGLPFGTRGGALIRYDFPVDGEYTITTTLLCFNTRGGDENCADGSSGFPDPHHLEISVDGERVQLFTLEPRPRRERYGDVARSDLTYAEQERWEVRVPVKAGPREVGVTFVKNPSVETVQRTYRLPFTKPILYRGSDRAMQITAPHVSKVTITGPFEPGRPGDTPSRQTIFVCRPASRSDEADCASSIVSRLARLAYRRPVTNADVQDLLRFYDQARTEGLDFEAGIERSLQALLVSPDFLFRIERDPADIAPATVYRISDLELASRLSFFLWSRIPDDELLDVAARGELRDPAVFERQVRRMLADTRSEALTSNFAEQWLQLRALGAVGPNESLFPNFDEALREAFERETELFIGSIMREDRSVLDLLTADYTFVNARLALHYGIPSVQGSHFRRVTLSPDSPRRGLLGHGSILTVTSHPTRTSPVKRGKWILDTLLGTPPPPPLPNVPPLEETQGNAKALSVRERMAVHRRAPVCASCHATIDPLGFALESFDAVGRFRLVDLDTNAPVDASGVLPDGTKFGGLAEFRAALVNHPERFVTTLVQKLMTYALGRGVEYYDMPAARGIVREAARSEYRFSSLILGIVNSVPFQMRRSAAPVEELSAAGP